MKRDMDRIRHLMLAIEGDDRLKGTANFRPQIGDWDITEETCQADIFQLVLLIEAGLVVGQAAGRMPSIQRLTWSGFEFLDTVRNPEVWAKTTATAKKVGGFGLDILVAVAKAEARRFAAEKLGLPL